MLQEPKNLTEYINPKLCINWREEAINKVYEPPCHIECDYNGKEDDAAGCQKEKRKHMIRSKGQSIKAKVLLSTYSDHMTILLFTSTFSLLEGSAWVLSSLC